MTEPLCEILSRFEIEHAGPITASEARRWGMELVERLCRLGILKSTTPAMSIRNDGCEHGCDMEPEIVTHTVSGERFGVHRCLREECGLVRIPLDDLRRWELDFLGIAVAVARAAGAGGQVTEDIPSRLVEVGHILVGDTWRDIFLARGLAWDDAATALRDARRLKASGAPLVLALATLPHTPVWADCNPALALLSDVITFDGGLKVDLSSAVDRPTNPHPDAVGSKLLTVTEAADHLLKADVLDGYDIVKAKSLISTAATRGQIVSNGKKRRDRRVESGSLASWILRLRQQNLAEDYNAPRRRRRRKR
jgi:hypothetical protein